MAPFQDEVKITVQISSTTTNTGMSLLTSAKSPPIVTYASNHLTVALQNSMLPYFCYVLFTKFHNIERYIFSFQ